MIEEFVKVTDRRVVEAFDLFNSECEEKQISAPESVKALRGMLQGLDASMKSVMLTMALGIPEPTLLTWAGVFYSMGYRDGTQKPAVDELEKLFKLEESK